MKIDSTSPNNWRLLHFKYWPTWVGLCVLYLLTRIPLKQQIKIGSVIGVLAYHLAKRRRRIAEVNISLCFPDKTQSERKRLVQRNFRSLGIGLMETATAWLRDPMDIRDTFTINGLDNLKNAAAQGKGVILLGFHFTTMDLAAAMLATHFNFNAMYRKTKNQLLNTAMTWGRQRNLSRAIERDDVRGVLQSLKKGETIWYGPDQDYGRKHSVFVPFFGVSAATISATSRLAKISGSPVVVFVHYRIADDSRYKIILSEPLQNFPTNNPETDARQINRLVEAAVMKYPEQYWWIHRRFKTRPAGVERPYK